MCNSHNLIIKSYNIVYQPINTFTLIFNTAIFIKKIEIVFKY